MHWPARLGISGRNGKHSSIDAAKEGRNEIETWRIDQQDTIARRRYPLDASCDCSRPRVQLFKRDGILVAVFAQKRKGWPISVSANTKLQEINQSANRPITRDGAIERWRRAIEYLMFGHNFGQSRSHTYCVSQDAVLRIGPRVVECRT